MEPSTEPDAQQPPRLPREVEHWRLGVLLRAGFDDTVASSLAGDGRVDLHDVLTLVDRGCPPVLAARILAPL